MEAIAAYVRQLRDMQGVSREHLAEMVGTSGNNIWRIEEKGQEPRGGLLLLIVQALKGSLDDAAVLLREDAGEDEGRRRAMVRLTASEVSEAERIATDPETAAIARRLAEDPQFFEMLSRTAAERAAELSRKRS